MKKIDKKNRLDKLFRADLRSTCERGMKRYSDYGFQKQAKVIKSFLKQADKELGGL